MHSFKCINLKKRIKEYWVSIQLKKLEKEQKIKFQFGKAEVTHMSCKKIRTIQNHAK